MCCTDLESRSEVLHALMQASNQASSNQNGHHLSISYKLKLSFHSPDLCLVSSVLIVLQISTITTKMDTIIILK